MIKRFGPWTIVLVLVVALILPTLPMVAQGENPGSPAADLDQAATDDDTDQDDDGDQDSDADDDNEDAPVSTVPVIVDRDGDGQADNVDPCPDDADDGCLVPPTDEPDQDDDVADPTDVPDPDNDADQDGDTDQDDDTGQAGDGAVDSLDEPPVQAADATSVEVYCKIPDSNLPNQRIVGTFLNFRTGYGDPTVTLTLYDLSNAVIGATGPSPMPATNPIIAPVTAAAPNPVKYEWGPGGFSKLTVSADYPSLDPASYPDSNVSLTISCVPTPPTPTPGPPPTIDPLYTPPPLPTAASYSPVITTEMKDTSGNTIPDDTTVAPGTGIYDTAVITGLPPGVSGEVIYAMSTGNCTGSIELVSGPYSVVADANGVVVPPNSAIFTAPGFPGGAYDWIVIYTDPAVGNVYGGCTRETFNVDPPLPSSGTGNAILTCFLDDPPVPGRAGYKVNVSPLPATGTVQVNVTLQLAGPINYDYKSVTLPPGTTDQLAYSGAYVFAWVNVIFRDAAGEIYAVINLEGACTATPGPTPTPAPTIIPTEAPTVTPTTTPGTSTTTPVMPSVTPVTPTSTTTATTTVVPSVTPTEMPPFTPVSTLTPTGTVTSTVPPTSTPPSGATPTHTPANTATAGPVDPSPAPEQTPIFTSLPNTGSGPGGSAGLASMLVAAAMVAALALWVTKRGQPAPDDTPNLPEKT